MEKKIIIRFEEETTSDEALEVLKFLRDCNYITYKIEDEIPSTK